MAYESKQKVLEEAGLSHEVLGETLSGTANGSNTIFTTAYKPLSDANYDDSVGISDVTAYVNGTPVAVSAITKTSGAITFAVAPATNATVTLDYRYQNIPDTFLDEVLEEATEAVEDAMKGIDPLPYSTVPATIRKITRYYAAGLLLLKDYGSMSDTELTSKDGDAKIKQAEKWLANYANIGGSTGIVEEDTQAEVSGDGDLFRIVDSDFQPTSVDYEFMTDPDGDN